MGTAFRLRTDVDACEKGSVTNNFKADQPMAWAMLSHAFKYVWDGQMRVTWWERECEKAEKGYRERKRLPKLLRGASITGRGPPDGQADGRM